MNRVGLIILYEVDGEKYLQFRNFRDFQNLRENREGKSKIPAPGLLPEDSRNTPIEVKLREVNLIKENIREEKAKHLDFVFLSSDEYKKLIERFGEDKTKEKIEALNLYLGSNGKKYKSHYHTILNWDRMEKEKKKSQPKGYFDE